MDEGFVSRANLCSNKESKAACLPAKLCIPTSAVASSPAIEAKMLNGDNPPAAPAVAAAISFRSALICWVKLSTVSGACSLGMTT